MNRNLVSGSGGRPLAERRACLTIDSLVKRGTLSAIAMILASATHSNLAAARVTTEQCGPWRISTFGNHDYRRPPRALLADVERNHFTLAAQGFVPGKSLTDSGGDLHYTLNVFPNHHPALVAAANLTARLGSNQPKGMRPIECYFDRALRFARDDLVVVGLYADWLIKQKRPSEAAFRTDQMVEMADGNPAIHHAAGLLYLELGDHGKALTQAHRAADLGWPKQDLADKLRAGGHWLDSPIIGSSPSRP
jgi:hypothetical protein